MPLAITDSWDTNAMLDSLVKFQSNNLLTNLNEKKFHVEQCFCCGETSIVTHHFVIQKHYTDKNINELFLHLSNTYYHITVSRDKNRSIRKIDDRLLKLLMLTIGSTVNLCDKHHRLLHGKLYGRTYWYNEETDTKINGKLGYLMKETKHKIDLLDQSIKRAQEYLNTQNLSHLREI